MVLTQAFDEVSDEAVNRVAYLIEKIMATVPKTIRQRTAREGTAMAILGRNQVGA